MDNCGIVALKKMRGLKGVSAFSLIHLARDNGMDLKIFKVPLKDLPLVHRPAIFHANNHFEYIENGHALPDLKWSGYVLTEKSIGLPVSLKQAKSVKGEGPLAAIPAIISSIATAATTAVSAVSAWAVGAGGIGAMTAGQALAASAISGGIYGAAAGAAYGGISGTGVGKGALQGGLLGAGIGGAGLAAKGATSLVGAAGRIGQAALTTGGGALVGANIASLTAPKEAGALATAKRALTGATIGGIAGGAGGAFLKGAQAAGQGATIGQQASAGFKNLFGISSGATPSAPTATTGASNLSTPLGNVSANNAINWAPGAETAARYSAPGLASAAGGTRFLPLPGDTSGAANALNNSVAAADRTVTLPGYTGPGTAPASTGPNLPNYSAPDLATGRGLVGANIGGAGQGVNFSNILNSEAGKKLAGAAIGTLVSGSGIGPQKPSASTITPTENFATLRSFLGDQKLPAATEAELVKYVHTPLADISKEMSFESDKTFRKINDSYDRQAANYNRQFAQAGQNIRNSSDLRNELSRLEKERATSLAEAQQEISNQNLVNAIQAKQFALSNSLSQNQFDDRLAFELADLIGKRQALEVSIQQDNYDDFQNILNEILQIGFPSQ